LLVGAGKFSHRPDATARCFTRSCITPADALRDFPPSCWKALGCVGSPAPRAALYRQVRELGFPARAVAPLPPGGAYTVLLEDT